MKRYWLSLVLVLFTVLCIGTYYIQAAVNHLPNFVLEKHMGDDGEAASVRLHGNYVNELVAITSQGSKYLSEQSFLERLALSGWSSDENDRLMKEHRQFMRGKRGSPSSFYEDESLLVYANVKSDTPRFQEDHHFRFAVSVLRKKQEKSSSYEVSIPQQDQYGMINVHDVQVVGEELKLITENLRRTDRTTEVHLYSLDLTGDKAPVGQILLSHAAETEEMRTELRRADTIDEMRPSRYIAYYVVQIKPVQSRDNVYSTEEVGGQALIYDIQTGREVKMESQEIADYLSGQTGSGFVSLTSDADNLILTAKSSEGIRLIQYNIPAAAATSVDIDADDVIEAKIKNQRLYMVMNNQDMSNPPLVAIADLNTGTMLYQGAISLQGAEQFRADQLRKLYVYDLDVR